MRRKAIIILGMHRSGTSAFAGVLSLLGINFGSHLMPPAFDNEKGYYENINIYNINEEILSALNSSWDDLLALPPEWWRESSLDVYKKRIRNIIREEFNHDELFAIKDPRLSLLFPLWQEILDDLNVDYYFVLPVRNPLEVAASLAKRNNFSLEKGVLLWANYNLEAERYSRKYPRIVFSYDKLLEHPEDFIRLLADRFDVARLRDLNDCRVDMNNFLEPALRHHISKSSNEEKRLFEYIFKLYQSFLDLSEGGSDSDCLPSIISSIDALGSGFIAMRDYYYVTEMHKQQRLRETEMKLHGAEIKIQQMEQGIRNMETSTSWRITAPLRFLKSFFK